MGPSAEDIESPSTPRNKLYARMLTLLETGSGAYEKEAMKHIGAHIRGMGISLCRYLKRTIHLLGAKLGRPSVSVTCLCASENARVHDFVHVPKCTNILFQDDSQDATRLLILDAFRDVIRSACPRLPGHVQYIVNHVVVLALDVTSQHYANSNFTRDVSWS